MQKLDISSYGVEELDANEMKNLDGGMLTMALVNTTLALGLLTSLLINRAVGALGDISVMIVGLRGAGPSPCPVCC